MKRIQGRMAVGFLLGLVAWFSDPALANELSCSGSDGYEVAVGVCQRLSFSEDRRACLAMVAQQRLFQAEAAETCGALRFGYDQDKVACLRAVARRQYTPAELQLCASETFSSDVAPCLRQAGRPMVEPGGCLDATLVLQRVRMARDFIDTERPISARNMLNALEDMARRCLGSPISDPH